MKRTSNFSRKLKIWLWKALSLLPFGHQLLRWRLNQVQRRRFQKIGDTKAIFRHHYQSNSWGSNESVSGPGSTLVYTTNLRSQLPLLVESLQIYSILDAPCGDFNWMRHVVWPRPIKYIGADIVDELIQKNIDNFGSTNQSFITLDITKDSLPNVDLWLCRDCLFHLSNNDIFLALNQFHKSNIPYLLTSTHPECHLNHDIPSGSFRFLNLQAPPFQLPSPVKWIDDWIPGQPVRRLGLWTKSQVSDALNIRRH